MIAIVFYAILAGLIVIAAFISNRLIKIFGWSLSPNKFFLLHAGVFVGILCILFFDHIIGAIQFKYVCHNKTKTMLSENWKKVQSAKLRTKKSASRFYCSSLLHRGRVLRRERWKGISLLYFLRKGRRCCL